MDEHEIRKIATRFREAIEKCNLTSGHVGQEAFSRMKNFPHCTCNEVSTLLGLYLVHKYNFSSLINYSGQVELGEKWLGTHSWLQSGNIVIDITADQFPMANCKVIVTKESEFHKNYIKQQFILTENFSFEDQPDWIINIYEEINAVIYKM
ncbi:MAG: hypothetical protein LAT57_11980 [Balneolales bacterium]|nr:hypothetical protein [Balneolales bacterium]